MEKIQLQSILCPDSSICEEESLYFHRRENEIQYDGYFNLFYIEKWKRYTDLKHLYLSIKLCGYQTLRLYHNRDCVQKIELDADVKKNYDIEFPWSQYKDGVFWFSLVEEQGAGKHNVEGFYIGVHENPRQIAIGIDICTYRREEYVLRNLKVLCERVLENENLQVAPHLWGYIIDNGKTLGAYEPVQQYLKEWKEKISVIPNKNAGGAGGFTRGMLEVLKDKEKRNLTHVVLMDDDAVLEPDLFVRMYGFLRAVKPEWNDIILGGTMMREDLPYMLYASGETWSEGLIRNANKNLDVRDYENATCENLLTTQKEKKLYSGWWCCCYSLNVVRDDNLPIPLFLHHDDIEYGLRNKNNGIVFLNGICVWHRYFEDSLPGSNLYYDIRNNFIEMTQRYDVRNAKKYIWRFYWKRIAFRLVNNKKDEVYWMVQGAKDFLKGPEWLWKQDAEELHRKIINNEYDSLIICWHKSIEICLQLLSYRKEKIVEYQKNIEKYTTKSAWKQYLKLNKN